MNLIVEVSLAQSPSILGREQYLQFWATTAVGFKNADTVP